MCCFFYDTATTDGYTYLHTHALHDALPILVNRVGDFGFALGIVALFAAVGSVNFDTVFHAAPGLAGKTFHFLWKDRSEEHTSELQSLMRISYAVFCLKKKINSKIRVPFTILLHQYTFLY